MFTEYVEKAMQQAEYEQMVDGNWWGQVTPLRYTWATGPTKEACAKELRDVVEDWLIDAIACHHPIPMIGSTTIYIPAVA